MKKFALFLFVAVLILPFWTVSVSAEIPRRGNLGENVTYSIDQEGTLTISGTGDIMDFNKFSAPFRFSTVINRILIEPGISGIGDYVFSECTGSSIIIPESVKTIGSSAFYNSKLNSIYIPNSVVSIGDNTFSNCGSLESVVIPNSVTSISDQMFYKCDRLYDVTIPNSITTIKRAAFYNCSSLNNIIIPDSVTHIEGSAFYGCSKLSSINLTDNLERVGNSAFYGCYGLYDVYISDLEKYLNIDFQPTIYINGEVSYYSNPAIYADNIFLNGRVLPDSIEIPETVNKIPAYAFADCKNLVKIYIPDSVVKIEKGAFFNCTSLNNVEYGGSEDDWENIYIDICNDFLTSANINYYLKTIPLAEVNVTKTETDAFWNFDIEISKTYADSFVYIVIYDDNGNIMIIKHIPLKTDNNTVMAIEKSSNYRTAKIFIWTKNMQPIAETHNIDL